MGTFPHFSISAFAPFVRAIPVIIIVILSAPAWLTWPFLSEARQRTVLKMVDALARWTRGDLAAMDSQDSKSKDIENQGNAVAALPPTHAHEAP